MGRIFVLGKRKEKENIAHRIKSWGEDKRTGGEFDGATFLLGREKHRGDELLPENAAEARQ